jgi:hypothetical protein
MPTTMSPEEAEYCQQALIKRDEHMAHLCGALGTAFHITGIVVDRWVVPPYKDLTDFTHYSVLTMLAAWYLVFHRFGKPFRYYLYSTQFIMVALYSFGLYLTIHRTGSVPDSLIASNSAITLALFMLVMCPFHNWIVPVTAIFYWGMAWAGINGYQATPYPWLYVYALVMVNGLLFQLGICRRVKVTALNEFRASNLALENERLRMEKDLAGAREVQDSLLPPPNSHFAGKLHASLFHRRHSRVGGDWMTLRPLPNGDLIVVVADATGKGIQAALVIHAVQSLWAEALGDADFDCKSWLIRVNATLCRMGVKTPHTATMGIAVISEAAITYWSAGHTPLFICHGFEGQKARVTTLVARGNLLGMDPTIDLKPAPMTVAPGEKIDVLLGSDGMLHKGTLHSGREIRQMVDVLRKEPEAVLDLSDVDDDRTLVWVDIDAA